jgi:hypothetical protein
MPLKVNSFTPQGGAPVALGRLSVLVGANNAGKSQTLRDLRDYIISGSVQRLTIVNNVDVVLPTELEAVEGLLSRPHQSPGHVRLLGVANDLQRQHEFAPGDDWVAQHFAQLPQPHAREQLLRNMGQYWCASLDAEGRFRLAAPVDSYDKRAEAPSNALQGFFSQGKPALTKLRNAFRTAFAMDIAIDWAAMRRLYLKIGPQFGEIPDTLAELDALLSNAQELSQQGDGYRSFAGVALAVLAFPNRLLLLDEPEAFLHPAQARALGRWIARESANRPAQIVVASHSADFLLGVISEAPAATVIRLNRGSDGTQFHVVPPTTSAGLIQSPLLSSQPVMDSLFHRGVVVCEGDPDRAIYQTVLHKFLGDLGGENLLLIHSNGKDAIKTPVTMLREAGTPVCAIVDIDVLNSKKSLSDIVEALTGSPATDRMGELRDSLAQKVEQSTDEELMKELRAAVEDWQKNEHTDLRVARKALVATARTKSSWEALKANGISYFTDEARAQADELFGLLQEVGLFVVPNGELEGWMKLGIAKGQRWSRAALERLHAGNCPDDLRSFMKKALDFVSR